MNQQSPTWLDSLSSGAAPEIPQGVLTALRARRRERHRKLAAGLAGCAAVFIIAAAAWVSYQPAGTPVQSPPIAGRGEVSEPVFPEPAPRGDVTVASMYGAADVFDFERLASAAPSSEDRLLRIGDHWDPERVEAWVLD